MTANLPCLLLIKIKLTVDLDLSYGEEGNNKSIQIEEENQLEQIYLSRGLRPDLKNALEPESEKSDNSYDNKNSATRTEILDSWNLLCETQEFVKASQIRQENSFKRLDSLESLDGMPESLKYEIRFNKRIFEVASQNEKLRNGAAVSGQIELEKIGRIENLTRGNQIVQGEDLKGEIPSFSTQNQDFLRNDKISETEQAFQKSENSSPHEKLEKIEEEQKNPEISKKIRIPKLGVFGSEFNLQKDDRERVGVGEFRELDRDKLKSDLNVILFSPEDLVENPFAVEMRFRGDWNSGGIEARYDSKKVGQSNVRSLRAKQSQKINPKQKRKFGKDRKSDLFHEFCKILYALNLFFFTQIIFEGEI